MVVSLTIDTEEDLHSKTYVSLNYGIPKILKICDRFEIKLTFFVPAMLLEKFPVLFKDLRNKGHEIALHGYEHERFDELSFNEKEKRIIKSILVYREIFNENPKGFRAPQHSIDNETLGLLSKYGFSYDSSYTPFNLLQLIFFPKKIKLFIEGFFKPRKIFLIKKNLYEIPVSGFLIAFVSLPLRIFPKPILKLYLSILKLTNKDLVFYAHSWDFINLPNSRIDKMFSHKKLTKNLELMIKYLVKKNKFLTMEQIANENS